MHGWVGLGLALAMAGSAITGSGMAGGAAAQVRDVDPNAAMRQDQAGPPGGYPAQGSPYPGNPPGRPSDPYASPRDTAPRPFDNRAPDRDAPPPRPDDNPRDASADATTQASNTYRREDLMAAGEGVFGKGAQGFGAIIERILKNQGQPNAYIAGHEVAGAFVVGLRYGSGVMSHKVEGRMPVYWTGPSLGFDVGGDGDKVFVLVYNLYDSDELYHRFPAAEGRLYAIGGFAATYLRRGKVVLIPVRLGVGWRAGVNVGYMKFSHKAKWLPF